MITMMITIVELRLNQSTTLPNWIKMTRQAFRTFKGTYWL